MPIKNLPNPQALPNERIRWLLKRCVVTEAHARVIAHLHWEGHRNG